MVSARGPGNLGAARGSIEIDTSSLARAEAASRRAGRNVSRNIDRMGDSARRTEQSFARLRSVGGELAGALGVSFGIAGAVALVRQAVAVDKLATAYERQEVAARNLAGGQEQLNRLLEAYDEATGNAVNDAQALSNVVALQAAGFADSAKELERFARAARGASVATGRTQEFIVNQTQLAIANETFQRLNEIGLGIDDVKGRIAELREENEDWTDQMIFQEAILSALEDRYAAVADAAESNATGVERANDAWEDARLVIGQTLRPLTDFIGTAISLKLQREIELLGQYEDAWRQVRREIERLAGLNFSGPQVGGFGGGGGSGGFRGPQGGGPGLSDDATEVVVDWAQERERIETETGDRINEVTREYNQQRADTISDFEQTIAREAADFARQRQRAEADLARRIADIQEERTRREEQWAEDLADRITDAQTESADRIAEWERDRNDRIAEVRTESNERLQELEEDYAREREQALRDHRNNILSAAGRLDARALHEEQRRFAAQEEAAAESHEDRIEDEREAERDRIRKVREQYRERVAQEEAALQETIRQAKEAHQDRLQDAREADARRIEDMRESFELQREREAQDRAIRLERMRQDHDDQLREQGREHDLRIQQIQNQGQEERTALDLEFQERLGELGHQSEQLLQQQKQLRDDAMELFDEFWKHVNETIGPGRQWPSIQDPTPRGFAHGGPVNSTGLAMLHAGEYVLNPGITSQLRNMLGSVSQPGLVGAVAGGRGLSVGDVSIQIHGAPGQSEEDLGRIVEQRLYEVFERLAE